MHTKHVSLRHCSLPVPFDQARAVLPVLIPASSGACCFTLFPDVSIISLCFRRQGVGAAAGTTGGAPAGQTTCPRAVVVVAGQDVNGLDLRLARFTSSLQPTPQIMEHAASVLVQLLPQRKKNMSWNAGRLVDYSVDIYHNMEKCCCVRKME